MEEDKKTKKVILTGIQPTGKLHLGNFLGAVGNWNKLIDEYDCWFFLANQHSITVPQVPANLRNNSLDCVAQYVACGLDPERCKIFLQSHVIGHTELMWVLACLIPVGQLERMTQFKDKSKKIGDSVSSGLLFYPALMAADILLYNADMVPTGEDQKQHLELTRDVAIKFNNTYSETFKVPDPYIGDAGARVMSLQNPTSKMSKSDSNMNATVFLTDSDDAINKKIMSAVTDSGSSITYDGKSKPGVSNLLSIYAATTGKNIQQAEHDFEGVTSYAPFKKAVADAVIGKLRPVRERYEEVSTDKDYLMNILLKGAEAAQKQADKTISKVYRKVGFLDKKFI